MKKKILITGSIIISIIIILVIFGRVLEYSLMDFSFTMGGESSIPKIKETPSALLDAEHNWPSYKGPSNDNRSSFIGIKKDWSDGLKKLWRVDYLCRGEKSVTWSCPAIKGNRLVVPGRYEDEDHIFCLNPDNGKLIWHQVYNAPSDSSDFGEGPRATPTIDEDKVYTLSHSGLLHCFQLLDGKVIWQADLTKLGAIVPKWGFAGSPVVYQDKLIVQSGGSSLLIAFNKNSGDIIWKSEAGEASYSTPVIVDINNQKQLLLLAGQAFYAFTVDHGKKLWQVPWLTSNNISIATPVVDPAQNIAVISSWYNMGTNVLKLFDSSADQLWTSKDLQAHQNDPFILDNFIYGFSGMSAHNRDEFVCLDLLTGEKKWGTKELGSGAFIYIDPFFLSLDIKGNLYLFKADQNGHELISSIKEIISVDRAKAWTKPIIANGKLYIRYANRLVCFDIEE